MNDINPKVSSPPPQKVPPKNFRKKKQSSPRILLTIFSISGFLVLVFYGILFWGVLSGDISNPLFESLGIQSHELKNLLLTFTNLFFGALSLFFLISSLVLLLKATILNQDPDQKKKIFIKSGFNLLFLFVFAGFWVFLYWFISNLDGGVKTTTPAQNYIQTIPKNTVGLNAPAQVEFSLSRRLYQKIPKKNILQVTWDFDGDQRIDATAENVSHRFLNKGRNNGRFPVSAQISYLQNGTEHTYTTRREVIITNENVVGKIDVSPKSGKAPIDMVFSASRSKDPDGQVLLYEWDFDNDGTYEIQQKKHESVSKRFTVSGDYPIKLRVTGSNHDTNVVEQTIYVGDSPGSIKAEITAESSLSGTLPLEVRLNANQSFIKKGRIVRYEWFITGDREPTLGRRLYRTIRKPGLYDVTLTVESDTGEKHQITKTIEAKVKKRNNQVQIKTTPKLFGKKVRGQVPFSVTFDSALSRVSNPVEWHWDVDGDGLIDSFTQVVKHTYREPGNYDVQLEIVDDEEHKFSTKVSVIVESAGTQTAIIATPQTGEAPLDVTFDASASSTDRGKIIDYIWTLPNGSEIHSGAILEYHFDKVGVFPMTVTALTSEGTKNAAQTFVSVRIPATKTEFDFHPKMTFTGKEVTFNPGNAEGLIQAYIWDFGDNATEKTITADPVYHVYKNPGTYDITLKTIDKDNLISSQKKQILIR